MVKSPWAYFFFGTLAPFFLASKRPIAIACFLLFTFLPLLPLLSLPLLYLCIASLTVFWAFLPYFAIFTCSCTIQRIYCKHRRILSYGCHLQNYRNHQRISRRFQRKAGRFPLRILNFLA